MAESQYLFSESQPLFDDDDFIEEEVIPATPELTQRSPPKKKRSRNISTPKTAIKDVTFAPKKKKKVDQSTPLIQ